MTGSEMDTNSTTLMQALNVIYNSTKLKNGTISQDYVADTTLRSTEVTTNDSLAATTQLPPTTAATTVPVFYSTYNPEISSVLPEAYNGTEEPQVWGSRFQNKETGVPASSLMRGESSEELAPLALILIIIFVLFGNLLLIVAVRLEKRLHRMTFYFFVSMSTAHILMATTAMPPAILVVFTGEFVYAEEICKLWVTVDLFLCNNTCLHLAFCSMDSFLRLKDSVRTGRPSTTCSLLLWLGAPWVISSVQAIAQFMLSQADEGIIQHGICFIPDKNFLILGTLFSFMIPAIIACVFYALSFQEIAGLRRGKYIVDESEASTQNVYDQRYCGSNESSMQDDDVSDTTSCVSDGPEQQPREPVQRQLREQVQLAVVTTIKDSQDQKQEESTSFCEDQEEEDSKSAANGGGCVGGGGEVNLAFADHLLSTDQSSSCTLLLREGTATADEVADHEHDCPCPDESLRYEIIVNRLMFMLLLMCIMLWIPFSISNIVYGLCEGCRKNMTFPEMLTFKWLAYSSAMVGPLVYAKYSDAVREAYWSIISCKYCRS